MVPFAGWEMPLQYSGITEEHQAVRQAAGLFDVSHMGEIEMAGADALAAVQRISSNDASRLAVGQAQYSALTTAEGTFVDDLLVYRLALEHFLLVVNASNVAKDFAWIKDGIQGIGDAVAVNTSTRYALVALQGPRALDILQPLTEVDLASIRHYHFAAGEVANIRATISRTGYTGEDGFEIFTAPVGRRPGVGDIAVDRRPSRAAPGRARRPGHAETRGGHASERAGHRRDDECPGGWAGWIVGWEKPDFVGRDALVRQREAGVTRKLVGVEMVERGIARHGYPVYVGEARVGVVTSGTRTPFLGKAIGLAYLSAAAAATGTGCAIEIRGLRVGRPGRAAAVLHTSTRVATMYPSDRRYTREHEWISVSGTTARVGITDYAQQQLGDVVFVGTAGGRAALRSRRAVRVDRVGQGGVRSVLSNGGQGGRGEHHAGRSS